MSIKSTILDEIRALKLPDSEGIIIIGGAFMELLGLRKADDIDLAVSESNWNFLCQQTHWAVRYKSGAPYIRDHDGRFDVWPGWYDKQNQRPIPYAELCENSATHSSGFRVPTIQYQIQLKHWENRPKDRVDINLLTDFTKR